jgi:transcriptional regulator with XRE-family HTH domain
MLIRMKNIASSKGRIALANNVKRLRKAAGLSQSDLAAKAGVAQTAISYIENPEGKSPSVDTVELIAEALKTPYWALCLSLEDTSPQTIANAERVLTTYVRAAPEGRRQIDRIAEIESRYLPPDP